MLDVFWMVYTRNENGRFTKFSQVSYRSFEACFEVSVLNSTLHSDIRSYQGAVGGGGGGVYV